MGFYEIKNLFKKHSTFDFDKLSPVNKFANGIPIFVKDSKPSSCSSCKACSNVCPVKAIQVENNSISFDYGACLQCSLCVKVCPQNILESSGFNYTFALNREELKIKYENGDFIPKEYNVSENVKEFQKLTGSKGFNYREVAAAGNVGVECELNASFNNVFDSEGQRVKCVASPKHADAILFSGPPGPNMEEPLNIAWKCTTEPKALIAAGSEAVSGGVFQKGKVPKEPDLFIGGDPPRPDVMIQAFRFLMGVYSFSFQKALHKFLKER